MKFEHSVRVDYQHSFRADRVAGMFDIDPAEYELEKTWSVDMPFEDIPDWRVGLIVGPSGSGKCLGPETEIIMYDGSFKRVDQIKVGDKLLGDDNKPRRVTAITRGRSKMYKIEPGRGYDTWRCNDKHIMTLVSGSKTALAERDEVVDIGIDEYLKLNKGQKPPLKQFSVGFDGWTRTDFPFDPYLMGLWLGDGSRGDVRIHNPDQEIIDYLHEFVDENPEYRLVSREDEEQCPCHSLRTKGKGMYAKNPFLDFVRTLIDVDGNKYVPTEYLTSAIDQRARLLAGLIDTDGYNGNGSIEIIQRSKPLADAVQFLARSLGLRVKRCVKRVEGYDHDYHRMSISGDFSHIPIRIERKKPGEFKGNRNPLRAGFEVIEEESEGDYVGIMVDGNQRFLKSDFVVVHNTTVARRAFGDAYHEGFEWDGRSLIDNFPKEMSSDEVVACLSSVGLSSPPSWLKPHHVLSNGEKFRADMARLIAEAPDDKPIVVDEFTSVVDRQVAKIASHCVAKNVRKKNKRFVAVSCHDDIAEWLEPDWIYQVDSGEFRRGSLRRPQLVLQVERRDNKVWRLFAGHHYLDASNHKSSHCYVASLEGKPVGFCSVLKFPHAHPNMANMWRASRSVCLPDYQGLGIGVKLIDAVGGIYVADGKRFRATASHPAMIHHFNNTPNWLMVRAPGRAPRPGKNSKITSQSHARLTASYEYVSDEHLAERQQKEVIDPK